MRIPALGLLSLLAASSLASADDTDEDGPIVGFPAISIALSVAGHETRIGDAAESGAGPALELALGRARWQYLVEGGFATAHRAAPTSGMPDTRVDGHLLRGALGARWLARQFRPDGTGGIELFLISLVGVQRYGFADGVERTRPEIALGVGFQGRMFRRPRFAVRLDARVLYTDGMGFASGAGVAW